MRRWLLLSCLLLSTQLLAEESRMTAVAYLYPQIGIRHGVSQLAWQDVVRMSEAEAKQLGLADRMLDLDRALVDEMVKSGVVSKATMVSWLQRQVNEGVKLQVIGPDHIRVNFRDAFRDGIAVKTLGQEAVKTRLQLLPVQDVQIAYAGPERNLQFSVQGRLSARVMANSSILPVRVPVQFTHSVEGKSSYRTLWFDVAYRQPVWVLKDAIAAKTGLEQGQLVKVLKGNDELEPDTQVDLPAEGKRFIADYEAGRVLTVGMLENIPAVDFGQDVLVAVKIGNIHIKTRGIARQTAEIGENIAVESLSSGETFMARVIDRGTVLVKDI